MNQNMPKVARQRAAFIRSSYFQKLAIYYPPSKFKKKIFINFGPSSFSLPRRASESKTGHKKLTTESNTFANTGELNKEQNTLKMVPFYNFVRQRDWHVISIERRNDLIIFEIQRMIFRLKYTIFWTFT